MLNKLFLKIKNFLFHKKNKKEYTIDDLLKRDAAIRSLDKPSDMVECENCKTIVPSDSIVVCSKCGKHGCKECFTCDASDSKYYCEDCW